MAGKRAERSYISQETVFIDWSVVRRVRRKAIQLQGQFLTRLVGRIYRQCLEELGLWEVREW